MSRPPGIFKRPPIFASRELLARHSKAVFADVAYNLAMRLSSDGNEAAIMLVEEEAERIRAEQRRAGQTWLSTTRGRAE